MGWIQAFKFTQEQVDDLKATPIPEAQITRIERVIETARALEDEESLSPNARDTRRILNNLSDISSDLLGRLSSLNEEVHCMIEDAGGLPLADIIKTLKNLNAKLIVAERDFNPPAGAPVKRFHLYLAINIAQVLNLPLSNNPGINDELTRVLGKIFVILGERRNLGDGSPPDVRSIITAAFGRVEK